MMNQQNRIIEALLELNDFKTQKLKSKKGIVIESESEQEVELKPKPKRNHEFVQNEFVVWNVNQEVKKKEFKSEVKKLGEFEFCELKPNPKKKGELMGIVKFKESKLNVE